MQKLFVFLIVVGATSVVGCRARSLSDDQADLRTQLLELYGDQVIDNLARIRLGLPAIQVDYKTMTGTATDLSKGTFAITRESTHSSSGSLKTNPSMTAEHDRTNQLTITGDPILDPEVYKAYEQYLGIAKPTTEPSTASTTAQSKSRTDLFPKPPQGQSSSVIYVVTMSPDDLTTPKQPEPVPEGEIVSSAERPDPQSYIVCTSRKYFGNYYSVPVRSRNQFWALYKKVVLHSKTGEAKAGASVDTLKNSLELFRLNQQLQLQ
jgi:hypothetical protein